MTRFPDDDSDDGGIRWRTGARRLWPADVFAEANRFLMPSDRYRLQTVSLMARP
jgi:hypothetical protein